VNNETNAEPAHPMMGHAHPRLEAHNDDDLDLPLPLEAGSSLHFGHFCPLLPPSHKSDAKKRRILLRNSLAGSKYMGSMGRTDPVQKVSTIQRHPCPASCQTTPSTGLYSVPALPVHPIQSSTTWGRLGSTRRRRRRRLSEKEEEEEEQQQQEQQPKFDQ